MSLVWLLLAPGAVFGQEELKAEPSIKVFHMPKQPKTGDRVAITVAAPRSVKSEDFVLQYQVVEPGKYIELKDPAYEKNWIDVPFTRSKQEKEGLERASMSAELPPEVQKNRRLIRYRIFSPGKAAVVAPAPEDAQPNFAYFVYDGIPEWEGAINPGGPGKEGKVVTFEPKVMRSVQAYHFIATQRSFEKVMWLERQDFSGPSGEYLYTGTLVADGKVYDHVRFRARGGTWRYAMGKNMWKIDFLKGHHLEACDNWGRKYPTKWGKLNLGACIQHGDYGTRGEQGMYDALSYRLFNLAGVEAPHTHWVQMRIVDEPEESPADQYHGDFWGLYLAVENPDDDFLEAHGLPDGNLYKMDVGGPEPKHLAEGGAADRADVLQFMSELRRAPDDQWWTSNVDLPRYFSYRAIIECIHHYDIEMGKNYFYFHSAKTKRWQVIPWDMDQTWGDQMFGRGVEPFKRAGVLQREPLKAEFEERLMEIRDLLFNAEQTDALIDEYAAVISRPDGGPSMVDADRAKWDYHPIMSSQYVLPQKSSPGLFYRLAPTRDFRGMTDLMKQYVEHRNQWVDQTILANANANAPATPVIAPASIGDISVPAWKLHLTRPASAQKVKWRLAEVTDPKNPVPKAKPPGKYEIDALWEAECGATAEIPTKELVKGHTYRIRARIEDGQGHWSHWSAPTQFTVSR